MNSSSDNSNSPDVSTTDEQSPKPRSQPNNEASAKVKEAQAKLMEAEASLMGTTNTANPSSRTAELPQSGPDRGTDTNDTNARRESATDKLQPAASRVSADAREHAPKAPFTEQLPENVAGMLCYLFGWISGLVFLLVDRRPFVRFHAAQSLAVFATLNILILALGGFFLGVLVPGIGAALLVVRRLLELVWLIAAVVLMLKAAGGEWFRIGVASHYGDRAAHGLK